MTHLVDEIKIANPQQQHCPTVLLLDASGSMAGPKIQALNEGLRIFKEEVSKDEMASKLVDLAVVSFSEGVDVLSDFTPIEKFEPTALTAGGHTSMRGGILKAVELVEARKQEYKRQGVSYYRPWIFMITDGEPTDMRPGGAEWNELIDTLNRGETDRKFAFFPVAVEPANTDNLQQIRQPAIQPVMLKGTKFVELFKWLEGTVVARARSKPGEQIKVPEPAASGWAMPPN